MLSALVFAFAHGRPHGYDLAVLFLDGLGFALAFHLTGALWVSTIWHLSKNLSVWFLFGSGTVDLAPGPWQFQTTGSAQLFGSAEHAGILDVAMTAAVVAVATWALFRGRRRKPGVPTAPCAARP